MANGLPWVRISSEISFDGEVELVSDAAFRTYIEIISISGHYLLDGVVPMRLVRKLCNTVDVGAALRELSSGEHPYLVVTDDTVRIPAYAKWQETSDQVKRRREADAERQRRRRTPDQTDSECHGVTDTVTPPVSHGTTSVQSTEYREESKSTEEEEEARARALPAAGTATLLTFILTTLPASDSTADDYQRVLDRHTQRLPRSQIERITLELAEWKPKKPRAQLHLTLNKWLAKEQPEVNPRPYVRGGRRQSNADRALALVRTMEREVGL